MAIVILNVLRDNGPSVRARVRHNNQDLTVEVMVDRAQALAAAGQPLLIELDHDAVVAWTLLDEDRPEAHGLFAHDEDTTRVVGRVHSVTGAGEGEHIVDIYLQAGPEFIAVSSAELGDTTPQVESGIALLVTGLRAYPTRV